MFNFRLTSTDPVERTPEFHELQQRAQEIIGTCQTELRSLLISSKKLEISNCRLNLLHSIMHCCKMFTISHFIWTLNQNNVSNNDHRTVMVAILSRQEIQNEIGLSGLELREAIKSFLAIPITDNAFDLESLAGVNIQNPPTTTDDIIKHLMALLLGPICAFRYARKVQERHLVISKLLHSESTTTATSDVAQTIDGVEPMDKKLWSR